MPTVHAWHTSIAYNFRMTNTRPRTRKVLAHNLRALIDAHEMSERALAQRSGISQGQINNILNERTSCSIETAEALARVFHVPVWHLLVSDMPIELVDSPAIGFLLEAYVRMDSEGRELLDAVARRELSRK